MKVSLSVDEAASITEAVQLSKDVRCMNEAVWVVFYNCVTYYRLSVLLQ